jgi:cobalt-zinc-cadmium efflux system membrane fusion protein
MSKKITLILAASVLFSCSRENADTESREAAVKPAFLRHVQTVPAQLGNPESELTLAGKVEYDPDRVVRYVPLVGGTVERTGFSLGDKVQKGQVLLDIRSSELSALQSESIAAEIGLAIAQRALQQAQSLYDDRMLSEKELLEARAKVMQEQAVLERIRSDMSLYRKKDGGAFSIIAPASGYIVEKNVAPGGSVATGGDPLFVIADLSRVWVVAGVYAGDLQFVREGMPVKIRSLSWPDEVFPGKIDVLSQVFDPEEKILKVRILMSNADLKFKPGMSVVVHLSRTMAVRQIVLPYDALIFNDNQYFVVVEKTPGNFEIRPVEPAGHNGRTACIRSGLSEGEHVVVKNQLLIYDGLKGK